MEIGKEYIVVLRKFLTNKSLLDKSIPNGTTFIDGEIVDNKTFETVRKATNKEVELFYNIRILKLKLKEMLR